MLRERERRGEGSKGASTTSKTRRGPVKLSCSLGRALSIFTGSSECLFSVGEGCTPPLSVDTGESEDICFSEWWNCGVVTHCSNALTSRLIIEASAHFPSDSATNNTSNLWTYTFTSTLYYPTRWLHKCMCANQLSSWKQAFDSKLEGDQKNVSGWSKPSLMGTGSFQHGLECSNYCFLSSTKLRWRLTIIGPAVTLTQRCRHTAVLCVCSSSHFKSFQATSSHIHIPQSARFHNQPIFLFFAIRHAN